MRVVSPLASNPEMGLMPERPWLRLSQKAAAPRPIDEVTPMPVSTTRRQVTAMGHLSLVRACRFRALGEHFRQSQHMLQLAAKNEVVIAENVLRARLVGMREQSPS